jgi:hypothetical protein
MADLDVEFDFENDLNTDVGQPAEAPSSMPASARKNYRQVSCKPERKLLAQLRRLALLFSPQTRCIKHRQFADTGCAGSA